MNHCWLSALRRCLALLFLVPALTWLSVLALVRFAFPSSVLSLASSGAVSRRSRFSLVTLTRFLLSFPRSYPLSIFGLRLSWAFRPNFIMADIA